MKGGVLVRKKPIVGSCCCGCTLHTGTLAITIYDLIIGILALIGSAIIAAAIGALKDDATIHLSGAVDDLLNGLYGLTVFLSIYYVIVVVLACLAIHGARTVSPQLLVPWLIGFPLRFLARVVVSIVIFAKASEYAQALVNAMNELEQEAGSGITYTYDASSLRTSIIGQAAGIIVEAALLLYFFLVVYSHFIELKNQRAQRQIAAANSPAVGMYPNQPAVGMYPPGVMVAPQYQQQQY